MVNSLCWGLISQPGMSFQGLLGLFAVVIEELFTRVDGVLGLQEESGDSGRLSPRSMEADMEGSAKPHTWLTIVIRRPRIFLGET